MHIFKTIHTYGCEEREGSCTNLSLTQQQRSNGCRHHQLLGKDGPTALSAPCSPGSKAFGHITGTLHIPPSQSPSYWVYLASGQTKYRSIIPYST